MWQPRSEHLAVRADRLRGRHPVLLLEVHALADLPPGHLHTHSTSVSSLALPPVTLPAGSNRAPPLPRRSRSSCSCTGVSACQPAVSWCTVKKGARKCGTQHAWAPPSPPHCDIEQPAAWSNNRQGQERRGGRWARTSFMIFASFSKQRCLSLTHLQNVQAFRQVLAAKTPRPCSPPELRLEVKVQNLMISGTLHMLHVQE